jgi:hypothetical protein
VLQMLGQKLKCIPVIKTIIALTFVPYPRPISNFPVLQGNDLCSIKKLVSDFTLRLLSHIVKGLDPKDVKPSGNRSHPNRLKNLVGCYYWFYV